MKFCAHCGNGNEDDSKFCRKCGNTFASSTGGDTVVGKPSPAPFPVSKPVPGTTVQGTPSPAAKPSETGMASLPPNVAHFLCYVAGWVSGIVFLIIEKNDRSTRFHAWQSIITFGAIMVFWWLFTLMPAVGLHSVWWFISWAVWGIVYIGALVLWIVLMVKAYQGYEYQLPVAGAIAHSLAYKDQPAESQPETQPQKAAPVTTKFDLPAAPPVKKTEDKATITKFCISCGESLPQKAVFCSRCGEKQS